MATKTIVNNPFADYGNLVIGDRFIGRETEISQIKNRILGKSSGNISVVGLPRIGKSSLVWNALIADKEDLFKQKKLVIEINIGSVDNSRDLFKAMASEVFEAIEDIMDTKWIDIFESSLKKFSNDLSDYEFRNTLFKYLRRIKKADYQVIYVFEEFDKGGDFLTLSDFQALREIGTRPEYSVNYVTVSRRTIQDLEAKNGALSRFYAIFDYLNLSVFSEEDVMKYWNRLNDLGVEVSEEYIRRVDSLVGSHPFLMDVVNYQVFNTHISSNSDGNILDILKNTFEGEDLNLLYHFDEIIDLMEDEGLKNKLFQAIVGPVFDLDIKSVEKLLKYGIVKDLKLQEEGQVKFIGFSQYFTDYLNLKRSEFPIWDLWSETESSLRELTKEYLKAKYGVDWEQPFLRKNPKKEGAIELLIKTRMKNQKTFGQRASESLVDYTYPADIYNIFMQTDWAWFNQIFKDNNKQWRERFNHLAIVRNPIAHNNKVFITSQQKNLAIDYCNLILDRMKEWKETKTDEIGDNKT